MSVLFWSAGARVTGHVKVLGALSEERRTRSFHQFQVKFVTFIATCSSNFCATELEKRQRADLSVFRYVPSPSEISAFEFFAGPN